MSMEQDMNASGFANRAVELLVDRGVDRDQPTGERSMKRCVDTFNAMTENCLTEEEGWQFMVFLKMARMQGGAFRQDDYEDAVSYAALMAEAATQARIEPVPAKPAFNPPGPVYPAPGHKIRASISSRKPEVNWSYEDQCFVSEKDRQLMENMK